MVCTSPKSIETLLVIEDEELNNLVPGTPVLFKAKKIGKYLKEVYNKVTVPFSVQEHPIEFPP